MTTISTKNTEKMKLLSKLLNLFRKKKDDGYYIGYICKGYCSHYCQITNIQDSIDNPTWYHYPDMATRRAWLEEGYTNAHVFQSHWQECNGGKRTYFFIYNPSKESGGVPQTKIPKEVYDQMILSCPDRSGCSRGYSLNETVNDIMSQRTTW